MTIEEAIHLIEGRAAVLRYLASAAAVNFEHPDRAALDGMADLAEDIEQYLQAVKQQLGAPSSTSSCQKRAGHSTDSPALPSSPGPLEYLNNTERRSGGIR